MTTTQTIDKEQLRRRKAARALALAKELAETDGLSLSKFQRFTQLCRDLRVTPESLVAAVSG